MLKKILPLIIRLIKIIYSISFSSVDCERGFSVQNLIKSKLCNSLSTKTLDMLMRLSIEGPESKDFDYNKTFIIWNKRCKRKGIIFLIVYIFIFCFFKKIFKLLVSQ